MAALPTRRNVEEAAHATGIGKADKRQLDLKIQHRRSAALSRILSDCPERQVVELPIMQQERDHHAHDERRAHYASPFGRRH
jgi:hypothetical protein